MNSNMVKPEKFDHLHLIYHFTVSLSFPGIYILVFVIFGMGLEVPMEFCVTAGFFKEKFALSKMTKDGPKMGFFNYFETFRH